MVPGQLPRVGVCCHRSRVEWYGKERPGLPEKVVGRGAKLEGLGRFE